MRYRIISFVTVVITMYLVVDFGLFGIPGGVSPSLVLGFMLLAAYCMGFVLARMGLPQITGYIFAGLLFGPFFLDYCNRSAINDLSFLNSLALAAERQAVHKVSADKHQMEGMMAFLEKRKPDFSTPPA